MKSSGLRSTYSTCSGLKTLYVWAFSNLDEKDAISLENIERSL